MSAYKHKLFLLLFLVSSLTPMISYSQVVKKKYYLLGGGGEPSGISTIFDSDLDLAAKFVNNSEWDTTVSFNGGHKITENIIRTKFGHARNAGSFVEKNYNNLLDEMINKIKDGELKSGDQLMVTINSHGSKKYGNEKTHHIALSYGEAKNLQYLDDAISVSLDKLEQLASLASKAKVKLAIIDLSCFSGNTLTIKNDNVCVISASGTEQYGYTAPYIPIYFGNLTFAFGPEFFSSLKKGRNLEDVYLRARVIGELPDFPMISTPEGIEINNMMYKLITPYLNYNSDKDRRITDFRDMYSEQNTEFEKKRCDLRGNFEQFQNLLDQLSPLESALDYLNIDNLYIARLKNALKNYRIYQLQYEHSIQNTFNVKSEIFKILNRDFPNDQNIWEPYDVLTLLTLDVNSTLKQFSKVDLDNPNNEFLANLKKLQKITSHVQMTLSAESRKKLNDHKMFFAKHDKSQELASAVSVAAKKVYNNLYESIKSKKSNPCRDFIL